MFDRCIRVTALLEYLDRDWPVSGNLAGVHVVSIVQYSFKLGVFSTPSKIVTPSSAAYGTQLTKVPLRQTWLTINVHECCESSNLEQVSSSHGISELGRVIAFISINGKYYITTWLFADHAHNTIMNYKICYHGNQNTEFIDIVNVCYIFNVC